MAQIQLISKDKKNVLKVNIKSLQLSQFSSEYLEGLTILDILTILNVY